jgi:hypothetical protein
MIRMDNRFSLMFWRSNCSMKFTRNGSSTDYSQILRGIQQKVVRYSILIYNLDKKGHFDEKTYSFKFILPSFREFGNVYDDRYMAPFYYYPIVMI